MKIYKFIIILAFHSILNSEVSDGLVLISDFINEKIDLIDINNEIVNSWEITEYDFFRAYLMPDSILVAISKNNNIPVIQKINWDGYVIWTYIFEEDICKMHHEQVVLPNGNILVLCRETINGSDNIYSNESLVLDKIIEVEPISENQANIARTPFKGGGGTNSNSPVS